MDREQIRAIFAEMATKVTCPACKHVGMELTWRRVKTPVLAFPLSGTDVGTVTELPHITCPECGAEADGNVPL